MPSSGSSRRSWSPPSASSGRPPTPPVTSGRDCKAMSLHDGTQAARIAARPAPARRGLGFALLIIATAQLMLVLDDTIVNVALPSIQRSLHLPVSSLNWGISFYALAFGG